MNATPTNQMAHSKIIPIYKIVNLPQNLCGTDITMKIFKNGQSWLINSYLKKREDMMI